MIKIISLVLLLVLVQGCAVFEQYATKENAMKVIESVHKKGRISDKNYKDLKKILEKKE